MTNPMTDDEMNELLDTVEKANHGEDPRYSQLSYMTERELSPEDHALWYMSRTGIPALINEVRRLRGNSPPSPGSQWV